MDSIALKKLRFYHIKIVLIDFKILTRNYFSKNRRPDYVIP